MIDRGRLTPLLDLIYTADSWWIVPTRLIIGIVLLVPLGGSFSQILAFCDANALSPCTIISIPEMMIGFSFIAGLGVRLWTPMVLLDFALRTVANAGALAGLQQPLIGFLRLGDDWTYSAAYAGLIMLTLDLYPIGAGAMSVDRLITLRRGSQGQTP